MAEQNPMTKKQNEHPEVTPAPQEEDDKFKHVTKKRGTLAVRGAIWSTINSVVPTILNSLVFIVTSRYLMPHDFGIIALTVSIVSFASALTPGALGEALIQKFSITGKLLDTVFWLCLTFALSIYLLLFLLGSPISLYLQQPEIKQFIPLIALKLVFDLLATVPNALIARSMEFHLIATRTIIATLLSAIICITLLYFGYGILALAISQVSTSVVNCIVAFIGARWKPKFNFNLSLIREVVKYGIFASGNRFLQLMNLDQILIGSLIGPTALGIFNFSRRMFQMVNDAVGGSLNSVSHALLSSMQNEKSKVKEAFLFATFSSSIIAFPAFVGLAVIVPDLIPHVFGEHWKTAIEPTQWFCLIGLMSCIGVIQSSLINSQGRNHWWFYYQLFRQALTISTIYLMQSFSIATIVMTIAIQTLLCWPITLMMVSKIINMQLFSYFKQFMTPLFASLMMVLSIYLFRQFINSHHPLIIISLNIAVGAAIYTSIMLITERKKLLIILNLIRKKHA